ncbi:hypothetical protein GBF38_022580 [Nibea albiflora]|uniref:Uncharacterized protein n=1 Tax=Nibea albiflora TaxID=240163 RepID=A0ACB7EXD6_NIBAL|nr:hypothetical protein GBF38_022580 [Nibea albiflora]
MDWRAAAEPGGPRPEYSAALTPGTASLTCLRAAGRSAVKRHWQPLRPALSLPLRSFDFSGGGEAAHADTHPQETVR